MAEYLKPIPVPSQVSQPYWEGCRRHVLQAQQCRGCGHRWMYPSRVCHGPDCAALDDYDWVPLSGRGEVYTFSVHHQAPSVEWAEDVPYVFGVVRLEEGMFLTTNVVGIDPADVRIGMPVEVVFDDVTEDIAIPRFRPVAQA